jgi:hypothetical protein
LVDRLQRRFALTDTIAGLKAFLQSQSLLEKSTQLMLSHPRRDLLDNDSSTTLGDLGLRMDTVRIEHE